MNPRSAEATCVSLPAFYQLCANTGGAPASAARSSAVAAPVLADAHPVVVHRLPADPCRRSELHPATVHIRTAPRRRRRHCKAARRLRWALTCAADNMSVRHRATGGAWKGGRQGHWRGMEREGLVVISNRAGSKLPPDIDGHCNGLPRLAGNSGEAFDSAESSWSVTPESAADPADYATFAADWAVWPRPSAASFDPSFDPAGSPCADRALTQSLLAAFPLRSKSAAAAVWAAWWAGAAGPRRTISQRLSRCELPFANC